MFDENSSCARAEVWCIDAGPRSDEYDHACGRVGGCGYRPMDIDDTTIGKRNPLASTKGRA